MSLSVGALRDVDEEEQAPIYCHSGIDLFVNLRIDPTESSQVDGLSAQNYIADAPKFSQTLRSGSVDIDDEAQLTSDRRVHDGKGNQFKTIWCGIQAGCRNDRTPFYANIDRREPPNGSLHLYSEEVTHQECRHVVLNETSGELERSGEVEDRPTVLEVGARKVLASFVSPSAHTVGERLCLNSSAQTSIEKHQGTRESIDHSDERFSEHCYDNSWDRENLGSQFGSGISRGNLVRGFHDLLANWKAGLQNAEHEDLGPCEVQCSVHEGPYVCIENRSWSPRVEDYSWVERMEICRDSDNRVTGCSDDSICLGERMGQDRATLPSSSLLFENEVVTQVEQVANPNLAISSTNSAEIECFEGADVLAARTIVGLSTACRKEVIEQELYFKELMEWDTAAILELSAICGQYVHNLGLRGPCDGDKSAEVVEKTYVTLPDFEIGTASNALKPRSEKLELWGDEDRYIPRVVRAKGRPRGSKFNTIIDFVNSEFEEESEDEILHRSPRKRRYKSMQELYS